MRHYPVTRIQQRLWDPVRTRPVRHLLYTPHLAGPATEGGSMATYRALVPSFFDKILQRLIQLRFYFSLWDVWFPPLFAVLFGPFFVLLPPLLVLYLPILPFGNSRNQIELCCCTARVPLSPRWSARRAFFGHAECPCTTFNLLPWLPSVPSKLQVASRTVGVEDVVIWVVLDGFFICSKGLLIALTRLL